MFWGDGAVKSGWENGSCETREADSDTVEQGRNICPVLYTAKEQGKETMEINNFVAKLLVAFLAGNAKDG